MGVCHDQRDYQAEYDRIMGSFRLLDIPIGVQAEVLEALASEAWDWFEDCDGCTGVSELYWPTKYFPPCVRHDYDWAIGKGGLSASRRFFRIQKAYGMHSMRAGIRAIAVTLAWYGWMKWKRRKLLAGLRAKEPSTLGPPDAEGFTQKNTPGTLAPPTLSSEADTR